MLQENKQVSHPSPLRNHVCNSKALQMNFKVISTMHRAKACFPTDPLMSKSRENYMDSIVSMLGSQNT